MALGFGIWLWSAFDVGGAWLHAKLGLVSLLLVYYLVSGFFLRRAMKHGVLPNGVVLRVFNESSLLMVVPVIYLAVSKSV